MLKFSLPEVDDFYADLVSHPKVLRVVALSGGYGRTEADARLAANHGVIASFSRASPKDCRYTRAKKSSTPLSKGLSRTSSVRPSPSLAGPVKAASTASCGRAADVLRFDHRKARPVTLKAKTISRWRCIPKTHGGTP